MNQNNCLLNLFVYVFNCLLKFIHVRTLHEIGHAKINYALNQLRVMVNVATLGVSRSF
jgi:hypothetical protein